MDAKSVIQEAINHLIDECDEDPRSKLIVDLKAIVAAQGDIPTGEIELTAILQPDGICCVHDQYGRPVRGVKSVAAYHDQSGAPILQVNL
ncbi:TPA: hypothetical protein ACVU5F_000713 [Vibrio parahaemolyticus]